ncbi:PA14 domain-containing protein [Streptomyces sp. NBC_01481]|uniref:PA14 domain-containing protein n=1 Tax=Streptomyces sp. NBC_01481 TaxID=2975869 RepID=UPI00224D50FB|nr:PA14 domain-containing protein [Streptomyces sp. NBC_01481]MCX4583767.1 PA14 domain-containing protein [Streptomyces sp. NBC_01481]
MHQRLRAACATAAAVGAAIAGLAVPSTAHAVTTCADGVWRATYYPNTSFSGTPKLTTCDAAINEGYGTGDPAAVSLPNDNFTVRWQTTRNFGSGGPFTFTTAVRDGIRVYLDGVRKIDIWQNVSTTQTRTVNLTIPSGRHTIRVDFVAFTGYANVKFDYAPRTSATVDTVAPLAPTGVSSSYDPATLKATVRWARNAEMDLAGYHVYRRLTGSTTWSRATSTPVTTTSLVNIPPATGQTYYYEVRAVDKAGRLSPGSADVPLATVDRTGPAAPSGLTVFMDHHSGNILRWNPVGDAARYEVSTAVQAAGPFTVLRETTELWYEDASAPFGEPRYYRLRAFDAAGNASAYSATVSGDRVDRTAPPAPTGLNTLVGTDGVRLYWTLPASFDIDWNNGGKVCIYRSPGTSVLPDAAQLHCTAQSLNEGDGQAWADSDVTEDTVYSYAVTALDPAGNESPRSAAVTVRTADTVAPAPLTGLRATPRADGMLLSWDDPADTDISSYRAVRGLRQTDGTVKWIGELATCADAPDDPLAMLCIGVPNGETHVYAVIATDTWGNTLSLTDPSVATVTATELALEPVEAVGDDPGPVYGGGGWTVSGAASRVHWTCSATACADITEYRLSRWNPAMGAYELLHTESAVTGTTSYAYLDETQPLGQTSFYRVVGLRSDGTLTAAAHPWRIRPDLA